MTDLVIKGTGNSRYLKSVSNFMTLYPTYADFVSALVAGTLPIDFNGINAAGIQTQGTPLNKANLLTDATATKYGQGSSATVNSILNQIPTGTFPNMTVGSATGATTAGTATNANNTDFTNAEWTIANVNSSVAMDTNGTYEVQVNDGETDEWFVFPLVTLVAGSRIIALAFADAPAKYLTFDWVGGNGVVRSNSTWIYSSQWRYRRIR